MEYELRIIPDCPNSIEALKLFRGTLAAAATGTAADIRVVELTSEEEAGALNFHGSPSFIAGGQDLFPSTAPPGLSCRVYQREAGLAGLPSREALESAILRAAADAAS